MRNIWPALVGLSLAGAPPVARADQVYGAASECQRPSEKAAMAIQRITWENSCSDECSNRRPPQLRAVTSKLLESRDGGTDEVWTKYMVVVGSKSNDSEGEVFVTYKVHAVSADIGFCTILSVEKYP
jgi:hypothetical protein